MARTICVVEDDPLVLETAVMFLEEAGFKVVEFTSGDDALRYLSDNATSVAVVFTDVKMPGEFDGVALANVVAMGWPWIKTLVTSGGPPRDPLPPTVEFLAKPWRPADLLARVYQGNPGWLMPDA
jgi:CheY-like chemotaxis protein